MRRRPILIALLVILALLVVAQIALPRIAGHRLRSRLDRYGEVASVSVHAFPAVELLWHRADRVEVHLRSYRSGQEPLADFLVSTRRVERLDVRVDDLETGTLRLLDAGLHKRGDRITGQAAVTEDALRAALPPGIDVRPIGSDAGGLLFQGSAGLFGLGVSVRLRAAVRNGAVTVAPAGLPLAGLATITVFSDPRIEVLSLGASPGAGGGFLLRAVARLR